MTRHDGRVPNQLRPIRVTPNFAPHAMGSVLIECGATRVICSAMVEETVPRWMKEQRVTGGWITAEYSMLPYSTVTRKPRDSTRGKLDGRSTEIQRLIGRSIRAVVDLDRLGPRTLWIDCDVLQADGGTRTVAITGSCIAVAMAFARLAEANVVESPPLRGMVAAVSVGIVDGNALLDLDYEEDKQASVDMNLVMTDTGQFVEVQGAGEEATFSREELDELLDLGRFGIATLLGDQKSAIEAATGIP